MALYPAYLKKPMPPARRPLIIGLLSFMAGAVAMFFLAQSHRASFPQESELEHATGRIERLYQTGRSSRSTSYVSRVVLHLEGQNQAFSFNPPRGFRHSIREIEETEGPITLHYLPSTHRVFRITTSSSELLTRDQAREGFNEVAAMWLLMAFFCLVAAAVVALMLIKSWFTRSSHK
ncbi:hypothetical protein [Maricaulis sp. MIT060901]|uniref:hypothetical protein n=1 Tax=Maricaulis sp. MIT060901 TaxID=3096993 RepID=UPI00399C4A50